MEEEEKRGEGGRGGREGGREKVLYFIEPQQPTLHYYILYGVKVAYQVEESCFLWLLMFAQKVSFLHCVINFVPFHLLHGHSLTFLILTRRMQLSNGISYLNSVMA